MNVRSYEDEKHINLDLSNDSNSLLFERISKELEAAFEIQWKTQLDGLDQRYWDFEINGVTLTFHLEHYLGICIFADKTKTDYKKAQSILIDIEKHFKVWKSAI
jgi:uncharacterized protein DUF3630